MAKNVNITLHFQVLEYLLTGERTRLQLIREFGAASTPAEHYLRAAVECGLVRRELRKVDGSRHPQYVYIPIKEMRDARPNAESTQDTPSQGEGCGEQDTAGSGAQFVLHGQGPTSSQSDVP